MQKTSRTEPPALLLLDFRLPWTASSYEAVCTAVGVSRLSGIELEPVTISTLVRRLAGEISDEEALAITLRHLGVSMDGTES